MVDNNIDPHWDAIIGLMRRRYTGVLMLVGGYDLADAEKALAEERADVIAFGRLFIANPDLPDRFRRRASLNTPDPSTFFGGAGAGYIDYPALPARQSQAA